MRGVTRPDKRMIIKMGSHGVNDERAKSTQLKRLPAKTRDKDATVAAIMQAASAVFAQHGLRASRTDEIADRAGVAKGLIFHYFKDKEHLFEAVLQRAYKPLHEVLDDKKLRSVSPEEALYSLVEQLLAAMSRCPQGPAMFLLESIQNQGQHYKKLGMPSIYRSLEDVLRRGVRQGVFRKMNAHNASVNIIGLCSYYFCATNNFVQDESSEEPLSAKAIARHSREVLAFVKAATRAK